MSVRERAGFLSPNLISELVWDRENKEVGASSHSISYFGNRILCIFRQPMKYLCFSYSSLDKGNVYRLSIPPHKYTLEMMAHFGRREQQSTKVGQKVSGVCVCEVRLLFLTLLYQGTTPQILKPKFPVHASGPKQKRK